MGLITFMDYWLMFATLAKKKSKSKFISAFYGAVQAIQVYSYGFKFAA